MLGRDFDVVVFDGLLGFLSCLVYVDLFLTLPSFCLFGIFVLPCLFRSVSDVAVFLSFLDFCLALSMKICF